jgi:hypothetical protein
VVSLVGIGCSPSCGVRATLDLPAATESRPPGTATSAMALASSHWFRLPSPVQDVGGEGEDIWLCARHGYLYILVHRKGVTVMRKLTVTDLLATLIVAAVVVAFIGYSVRGSMPFVQDPWGMAGVGIVGAMLTVAALGRKAFGTGAFEVTMVTLGVLTIGFGIAALIAETAWALLVPMVVGLVLLWVLALVHDAGYDAPGHLKVNEVRRKIVDAR